MGLSTLSFPEPTTSELSPAEAEAEYFKAASFRQTEGFLKHFAAISLVDVQVYNQIYRELNLEECLMMFEDFYTFTLDCSERFALLQGVKNWIALKVLGPERIHLAPAVSYHPDYNPFLDLENPVETYWTGLTFSAFKSFCKRYQNFFARQAPVILKCYSEEGKGFQDMATTSARTIPEDGRLNTVPFYLSLLTGLSCYLDASSKHDYSQIRYLTRICIHHLYGICVKIEIFPLGTEPSSPEDFLNVVLGEEVLEGRSGQDYLLKFFAFVLKGDFTNEDRFRHLSNLIEILINRAYLRKDKAFVEGNIAPEKLRLMPFSRLKVYVDYLVGREDEEWQSVDQGGEVGELEDVIDQGVAQDLLRAMGSNLGRLFLADSYDGFAPIEEDEDPPSSFVRRVASVQKGNWASLPSTSLSDLSSDEGQTPAAEQDEYEGSLLVPGQPQILTSYPIPPLSPSSPAAILAFTAGSVMAVVGVGVCLTLFTPDRQAAHVQAASSGNVVEPSPVPVYVSNPSSIPAGLQVINPGLIPSIDADASVIRSFLAELTTADALAVFYCPSDEQMQDLQIFSRNPFKFIYELDGELLVRPDKQMQDLQVFARNPFKFIYELDGRLLVRLDSWAFTREYTLSCDGLSPNTYYGKPLFREVTLN